MPNSDYQYRIGQIFKAIHFLIGLGNEMLKGVFLRAFFYHSIDVRSLSL